MLYYPSISAYVYIKPNNTLKTSERKREHEHLCRPGIPFAAFVLRSRARATHPVGNLYRPFMVPHSVKW